MNCGSIWQFKGRNPHEVRQHLAVQGDAILMDPSDTFPIEK